MQVTKITEEGQMPSRNPRTFTMGELQQEYDYYMAQKLLKKLREADLISEGEFNKITALNRQTFSPYLAELMPEMT